MMQSSQSFSRMYWRILLGPLPASPENSGEPFCMIAILPLGVQLLQPVQHKELLPVRDFGQTRRKASLLALGGLCLHSLLLPLPVDAEGRVGDDIAEAVVGKLIFAERVAEPHIVRVAVPDHHIRLGNGEGGGVDLLPEAGDLRLRVDLVNPLLHAGKHLAGAHRHIIDGDVFLPGQILAGDENVRHKIDNIPAGKVRSGLLSKGLGEAANQILEDIAAVHGADLIRTEIALLGGKFLDDQIEGVALHKALDDIVKVELCQHVLHIGGKAVQIVPEVALDVLRVCQQAGKGKLAGVVELIAGGLAEKPVDDCQLLNFLVGL